MRGPTHGACHALPPLRNQGDALSRRARGLDELDAIDAVFTALANEHRRHILITLQARGGSMTAGELASRFGHSWSTTTRHLQKLEAAGLVSVTKIGRERHYHLDVGHLSTITDLYLAPFSASTGGGAGRPDVT